MSNVIEVVAAVRREGDKYWVCRRKANGSHGGLAGMWEYPGGKVEVGETLVEALHREMWEEFGVHVDVGRHLDAVLATAPWDGGKQLYRVHFFDVTFDDGIVQLRCHDLTKWCTVEQLQRDKHLPSGVEFNKRLQQAAHDRAKDLAMAGRFDEVCAEYGLTFGDDSATYHNFVAAMVRAAVAA